MNSTPMAAPSPEPPAASTVPAPAPPQSPGQFGAHGYHHGLSLLHGWLPLTLELVAVALLVLAVLRFQRRWWLIRLPICLVIGLLTAAGGWLYMTDQGLASDPAPRMLWVWVTVAAAAVAVAIVGWPKARWWQRVAALVSVPFAVASAGVVLNQWVGYYSSVQEAWGAWTAGPLPHQTDMAALAGMRGKPPATGVVVPVQIPDAGSGFSSRTEYVYLPPAWFVGDTPPTLPVLMMIGGEFNTPSDWLRTGQIMPTVDQYTANNGGQAPIMVFVDSSGAFNNDTECVDGPRGNAASHMTKDVEPYLEKQFGASTDPAKWAVEGWSMGGTCAVDLVAMHPELFHTFVDIAGDAGPTAGTKQQTIDRLYGGDASQWDHYDPATVMAKHGTYTGVAGVFDDLTSVPRPNRPGAPHRPPPDAMNATHSGFGGQDGTRDPEETGAASQLCSAGRQVGIDCTVHTTRSGHSWQFATSAFSSSFPWIAARLGIPAPTSK